MLTKRIIAISLPIAFIITAFESIFGLAMLGIGFDSANDTALSICLMAPLPVCFLALRSRLLGAFALWVAFLALWITRCFIPPRQLISPFDSWYPDSQIFVALLLSFAAFAQSRFFGNSHAD